MSEQSEGKAPTVSPTNKVLAGIGVAIGAIAVAAVVAAVVVNPRSAAERNRVESDRKTEQARRMLVHLGSVRAAIAEPVPSEPDTASLTQWTDEQIDQLLRRTDAEGKAAWERAEGLGATVDQAVKTAEESRDSLAKNIKQDESLLSSAEKLLQEAVSLDRNNVDARSLLGLVKTHQAWIAKSRGLTLRIRARVQQSQVLGLLNSLGQLQDRAALLKAMAPSKALRLSTAAKEKVQAKIAKLQSDLAKLDEQIAGKAEKIEALTKQRDALRDKYNQQLQALEPRSDEQSLGDLKKALAIKAQADELEAQIDALQEGTNAEGRVKAYYSEVGEVSRYEVTGGRLVVGLNGLKSDKKLIETRIKGEQAAVKGIDRQIEKLKKSGRDSVAAAAEVEQQAVKAAAEIAKTLAAAQELAVQARRHDSEAIDLLDEAADQLGQALSAHDSQLRRYRGDSDVAAASRKLQERKATLQSARAAVLLLRGLIRVSWAVGEQSLEETQAAVQQASKGLELPATRNAAISVGGLEERLRAAETDGQQAYAAYDAAVQAAGAAPYAWLYQLGKAQALYLQAQAAEALVTARPETRPAKSAKEALSEAQTILNEQVLQGREKSPHLVAALELLKQVQSQL